VYVERAYLTAFHDTVAAEKDYRHALELNPNEAEASEGLAGILADQPTRRADAVRAIDQARKLNPLEPRLDVIKATIVFYWRGDMDSAADLLVAALNRNPLYEPALARLEEVRWVNGQGAAAVNLGEQVLARDPQSDLARQILQLAYLDMGELAAAKAVTPANGNGAASMHIALSLYGRDFKHAAELAYAAAASNTLAGVGEIRAVRAIRIAARQTGGLARAAAFFEQRGAISWDKSGPLVQGDVTSMQVNAIGLADMLLQQGERTRARQLLEASLAAMDHDERDNQRGAIWYFVTRSLALAMLERNDEALAALRRGFELHAPLQEGWYYFEIEPVFAGLRKDARFAALRAQLQALMKTQIMELQRLRSQGLVPARGARPAGAGGLLPAILPKSSAILRATFMRRSALSAPNIPEMTLHPTAE
jgi:tetratricopeptide (TPR) repeat protein